MSGRVEGKVVVLTGAAGGQGVVEAEWLVREGGMVIGTEVHAERPQPPTGPDAYAYGRLDVPTRESGDDLETISYWCSEHRPLRQPMAGTISWFRSLELVGNAYR